MINTVSRYSSYRDAQRIGPSMQATIKPVARIAEQAFVTAEFRQAFPQLSAKVTPNGIELGSIRFATLKLGRAAVYDPGAIRR